MMARRDGAVGPFAGQAVGGKGLRRAPEHVARKLIEDDDRSEKILRRLSLRIEAAALYQCVGVEKAGADVFVQFRAGLEPHLARCVCRRIAEPELKDVLGDLLHSLKLPDP